MGLFDLVQKLPGVGPASAKLLNSRGIYTVEDLLFYVPYKYKDKTNLKKINELIAGEETGVEGEIQKINNIYTRNGKRLTRALLKDDTGILNILWFNQHFIKKSLPEGSRVRLFGTLDDKGNTLQFLNPEYEKIEDKDLIHTTGISPTYSSIEGLSTRWLRKTIHAALKYTEIAEILPETKHNLNPRYKAFYNVHFPESPNLAEKARYRLAFEEMLFVHLKGTHLQSGWQKENTGISVKAERTALEKFKKNLSFRLTNAQEKSISQIIADLASNKPMNRLLQGDVGSGKTVVAAAALLANSYSNYNSIFLAPTQTLANQHFETLKDFFKDFDIELELVTGQSRKRPVLSEGQPSKMIVGTHAILHRLKEFSNIGLIIVDEQHKFGVSQRSILVEHFSGKEIPNLLTMTATPIPRSLALTFYGNLDLSILDELPPGRKEVQTWVVKDNKRQDMYKWIAEGIRKKGIQVFVVCPFIEQSAHENFQNVKAAQDEFENLKKVFKEFRLELLHGNLKPAEKNRIIDDFAAGKVNILVTTPVIEVGIDIPNANIIVIETPERFGLASLHQLRGRVGRGKEQGYCILLTSSQAGQQAERRLKFLEKTHLGNKLAEYDLKTRGPGNIYGTLQHGFPELKVADFTDIDLIQKTKVMAEEIYREIDKHKLIKERLDRITKGIGDN